MTIQDSADRLSAVRSSVDASRPSPRRSGTPLARSADRRWPQLEKNLNTRMDELARALRGPRARRGETRGTASSASSAARSTSTRCSTRTLEAASRRGLRRRPRLDRAHRRPAARHDARVSHGGGRAPGDRRPAAAPGPARSRSAIEYATTTRAANRDRSRRGSPSRSPDASADVGLSSPSSPARPSQSSATTRRRARGARAARRARDRERPAFPEARQLADLDALTGLHNRRYFHETLAREVARAHRYEPRPGPGRLRPRRLQGDQRPDRPPRRGRGARRGGRTGPRRRALRRHRLPRRRRRVRGHPPRVDGLATPSSSTGGSERGLGAAGRSAGRQIFFSAGIAELRPGTTRSPSSSGPTTRSTARRKSARTAQTPPARITEKYGPDVEGEPTGYEAPPFGNLGTTGLSSERSPVLRCCQLQARLSEKSRRLRWAGSPAGAFDRDRDDRSRLNRHRQGHDHLRSCEHGCRGRGLRVRPDEPRLVGLAQGASPRRSSTRYPRPVLPIARMMPGTAVDRNTLRARPGKQRDDLLRLSGAYRRLVVGADARDEAHEPRRIAPTPARAARAAIVAPETPFPGDSSTVPTTTFGGSALDGWSYPCSSRSGRSATGQARGSLPSRRPP